MPIKIDAEQILHELSNKPPGKVRTTVSLSAETWESFQANCRDVPASQVLETLMDLFNESAEAGRKS